MYKLPMITKLTKLIKIIEIFDFNNKNMLHHFALILQIRVEYSDQNKLGFHKGT